VSIADQRLHGKHFDLGAALLEGSCGARDDAVSVAGLVDAASFLFEVNVVVHDTVTIDGATSEDTFDWYAQDRDGNVWYFGEDTKKFNGSTVDTTGSFQAGVNGALPGVVMPGSPQVGDHYRQEYARNVAEDAGEVLSLTGSETTPLTGPTTALLVTEDTDLLDPTGPTENRRDSRFRPPT
jgi:hypothetical protein